MSREILYRAKRVDWKYLPKEEWWIEGMPNYDINGNITEFRNCKGFGNFNVITIDPETICEYLRIPDKNGKKIFEKDIVKSEIVGNIMIGEVVWFDIGMCGFFFKHENSYYSIAKDERTGKSNVEVLGNTFDNHELLKSLVEE